MKLRLLVVLALVMTCCSFLYAKDTKVETKPDTRLDQKVTYQAKDEFLYKVLDDLTNKTKIDMDCGRTSKDWQVREVKISVFVKDMPLKDFQKSLAELLHFKWSRGVKDGVPYYRLTQDLKAKKEQEELVVAAEEAIKKKQFEARKSAMAELDKLDSLSPEEIEKLKTDSPWLYLLAKEPFGKAYLQLMRSVPNARQALLDGGQMEKSCNDLSPTATAAARTAVLELSKLVKTIDPDGSQGDRMATMAERISEATFQIKPVNTLSSMTAGYYARMTMELAGCSVFDLPFFDPKSPEANATARMILKIQNGEPPQAAGKEMQKMQQERKELEKAELEPLPENPELDKTVKLELKSQISDADMMEELAKKSDFQFISDSFPGWKTNTTTTEGKVRVFIDDMRSSFNKEAEIQDKLIVLQDKEWFKKRGWAVYEEWMKYWRQKAENYTLTIDDIADIASLTDEQINNTIFQDNTLRQSAWNIQQNKDILRFYASLSKDQKSSLTSGGLGVEDVSDEQWAAFEKLIPVAKRSAEDENTLGRLRMEMQDFSKDRFVSFRLMMAADPSNPESTDTELKNWYISLPMKREPNPEKK